jgi:hypothetical protein
MLGVRQGVARPLWRSGSSRLQEVAPGMKEHQKEHQ